MEFEGFPTEILLKIVEQLPLGPLLIFRGVSRQWRDLIPTLEIPRERRDLYNLYMECINTPAFIESRSWITRFLKPFDRLAFIDAIYSQECPFIPEQFRLFILEWPEMAVIPHWWPGLPYYYSLKEDALCEERVHAVGCNSLARQPPIVSAALYYPHEDEEVDLVPALLLHVGLSCIPRMGLCLEKGGPIEGGNDVNDWEGIYFDDWVHFLKDFALGWLKDKCLWHHET
ncbi:hypothetical protein BDP27DRAFT_1326292 [Rhodocollybia butyracea]|uniref:F-box domain-containing protein n=1 Tax=Rhodocollybia butyracea TaxID=206335 RepID=A0A9P5PN81_9AGAR|nr:hypothetical protein BDP27DRAFT_1326292 [Rhodocollybia butyracea]